jgi:hypothetical protein
MEVRKLVQEWAAKFNTDVSDIWTENKFAGLDCFPGFLKRNTDISIRQPKATGFTRCNSSNKENVKQFFDKLSTVLGRCNIPPCHTIYMRRGPHKMVAQKGTKKSVIRHPRRTRWNGRCGRKRLRKSSSTHIHSSPASYSETIPFRTDLQAAMKLETYQLGK